MTQDNSRESPAPTAVEADQSQESVFFIQSDTGEVLGKTKSQESPKGIRHRLQELKESLDDNRKHFAIVAREEGDSVLSFPPLGLETDDIEAVLTDLLRLAMDQSDLRLADGEQLFNELVSNRFFEDIVPVDGEEQQQHFFQELVVPCANLAHRILSEGISPDVTHPRWEEIRCEAAIATLSFVPIIMVILSAPDNDCFVEVLGLGKLEQKRD